MIKNFFKFIGWSILSTIGAVILLPITVVGFGIWKTIPLVKITFPVTGFIFGVCYPLVYLITKWELVITRDPYSIMVLLFPLIYWKIMDSMGKISFPPVFVIAPYVIVALTILTMAIAGL